MRLVIVCAILCALTGSVVGEDDRLATLAMAGGAMPTRNRVCDGLKRHLICHFNGGASLVRDLPPSENLSYGLPSIAFTDHGDVHIVIQQCEVICTPSSP